MVMGGYLKRALDVQVVSCDVVTSRVYPNISWSVALGAILTCFANARASEHTPFPSSMAPTPLSDEPGVYRSVPRAYAAAQLQEAQP